MRKLLLGAFLFGTANLVATGCIFVTDDDDDPPIDQTGDINVSWNITPACPVGSTTAALNAAPTNGGQAFTNLFDCTAGAGVIDDLPAGTYDVFVNIEDDNGTLFAQSFAEANVQVNAGAAVTVDTFEILADDGFFAFDWTISENATLVADCSALLTNLPCGNDNQCSGIGGVCDLGLSLCRAPAAEVGLVATVVEDNSFINDEFTCAATGEAQTAAFGVQQYRDVIFSLLDGTGASLLDSEAIATADITIGNSIVDLGTVDFEFTTP